MWLFKGYFLRLFTKTLLFVAFGLQVFAIDFSQLTEEKQELIRQKARAIEAGESRAKYDWIGSFSLGASVTENSVSGSNDTKRSEQASINFTQDLFRSGGITGSIDSAKRVANLSRLQLENELFGYLSNLAVLRINYEIDNLKLLQNEKQLKNSEITLFIKKRQYEVGIADITQLNDAIRDKNNVQNLRVNLENSRANRELEISKLSRLNPKDIELPKYESVDRDFFVQNSFSLLIAKEQERIAQADKTITTSNYLPTLSANAKYGYQKNEGFAGDDFYSYGLSFVMPLKFTAFSAVEEKKAEALKAFSNIQSVLQESGAQYDQIVDLFASKMRSIELLQENIVLYDELIKITKQSVLVGEKSKFDLEMLENSREIDNIEIKINELLLDIEKAKLFYMISQKKGNR